MNADYSTAEVIGITTPIKPGLTTSEDIVSYCARVSNPKNQLKTETSARLLGYLIEHAHWSPFEMANIVVEVKTTRDIARQALRHRSFSFQEFSQRYAEAIEFQLREPRLQDTTNRQNSTKLDMTDPEEKLLYRYWQEKQTDVLKAAKGAYEWALRNGIAKEQARAVLPEGMTMSTMTMNGTLRSWIHYCAPAYGIRTVEHGTQLEHAYLGSVCWEAIYPYFPSILEYISGQRT